MQRSHAERVPSSPCPRSALDELRAFTEGRRASRTPVKDLEEFEKELHARVVEVEREVLARELERFDIDLPVVVIDGVEHRRVLRCAETYVVAAGPVRVERTLYRSGEGEPTVCAMELRAGIVEGRYTRHAAKLATWVVAQMTPGRAEELFLRVGGMTPSRSSLDRLPKQLSGRWEADRERFEGELRAAESVPDEAVSMAVSLDGVMAPMKNGQRKDKRAQAAADGKQTKGPAGYREIGCGTMSFYDDEGERLLTRRLARMPEPGKASLKEALTAEVHAALTERPDLALVKVADGAKDNWTYLADDLPAGAEVLDFFHATEHLNNALVAAYGETHPKRRSQYDKLRAVLRDDADGVDKVIRALVYLRDKRPRKKNLAKELAYFRRYRHRMRYADIRKHNVPIGSGVVEAACKTLVTQRMKGSGMRWCNHGGQAILTFRALTQSDRFDRAWELLGETYTARVVWPDNVIPLRPPRG